MAERRKLDYADTDSARRDIAALRAGERHVGSWTLPQACWHVSRPLVMCLRPPATTEPHARQQQMQERTRAMVKTGPMPDGLPVAPGTEPSANVGDEAIDEYVAALDALDNYRGDFVDFGPIFGPAPIDFFREFVLYHASHHFSFFSPTKARPTLKFADEAAMLADLGALRRGYERVGNWSLPQIAWHLTTALPRPLAAATEADVDALTDAQRDRQKRWNFYIAHRHPPAGFQAPSNLLPPADAGDAAVDSLESLLREFAAFKGEFVVSAAGAMPIARARGFVLAHGAHHLAYLKPSAGKGAANA